MDASLSQLPLILSKRDPNEAFNKTAATFKSRPHKAPLTTFSLVVCMCNDFKAGGRSQAHVVCGQISDRTSPKSICAVLANIAPDRGLAVPSVSLHAIS